MLSYYKPVICYGGKREPSYMIMRSCYSENLNTGDEYVPIHTTQVFVRFQVRIMCSEEWIENGLEIT